MKLKLVLLISLIFPLSSLANGPCGGLFGEAGKSGLETQSGETTKLFQAWKEHAPRFEGWPVGFGQNRWGELESYLKLVGSLIRSPEVAELSNTLRAHVFDLIHRVTFAVGEEERKPLSIALGRALGAFPQMVRVDDFRLIVGMIFDGRITLDGHFWVGENRSVEVVNQSFHMESPRTHFFRYWLGANSPGTSKDQARRKKIYDDRLILAAGSADSLEVDRALRSIAQVTIESSRLYDFLVSFESSVGSQSAEWSKTNHLRISQVLHTLGKMVRAGAAWNGTSLNKYEMLYDSTKHGLIRELCLEAVAVSQFRTSAFWGRAVDWMFEVANSREKNSDEVKIAERVLQTHLLDSSQLRPLGTRSQIKEILRAAITRNASRGLTPAIEVKRYVSLFPYDPALAAEKVIGLLDPARSYQELQSALEGLGPANVRQTFDYPSRLKLSRHLLKRMSHPKLLAMALKILKGEGRRGVVEGLSNSGIEATLRNVLEERKDLAPDAAIMGLEILASLENHSGMGAESSLSQMGFWFNRLKSQRVKERALAFAHLKDSWGTSIARRGLSGASFNRTLLERLIAFHRQEGFNMEIGQLLNILNDRELVPADLLLINSKVFEESARQAEHLNH